MQNLPRATTAGSKLRQCVVAPAGCSIVVCDLGQIEARLVAWQAGATTLLKQFANKLDPYARLAESIFGYKVDRKVQIAEGFVGKSGILGLGYGLGKDNFYIKTLQGARGQKVDLGALFTAEVAERTVKTYRKDNSEIPEFWSHLSYVLSSAFSGKSAAVQVGPVEIGEGYVTLPDGLVLQYGEPRTAKGQTSYKHPYGYRKKLWGGAFCENITQALAGQLIRDTWLRLDKLGYRAVWQVHDELIFVVPDTDLEDAKRIIHAEMVRCPKWAPDLPLSADIGSGKNYGACK
jgi:DNA polymerase